MSSVQGIDQLLGELRSAAALAAGKSPTATAAEGASQAPDFASLLQQSIDQVNSVQKTAEAQQTAFQSGSPDANLQDVMVSLQKASLNFQTMVQVRNKLVTAYQEIMNMQV